MHVRQASPADGDPVRELVERSMLSSYSLGPGTITAAVGEWFGTDALAEKRDDGDRAVFVAERDDAIVGVVDAAYVPETGTGDVLWLHVHPDYRGEGIGRRLFEAATDWLADAGADHVRGLVLSNNADGNAFYRELGFERVGEREVEIDGTPYTEHVYHGEGRERVTVLEDDGREVYVDLEDASRGSLGPFFTVFADADKTERYGFQCGHCDTLATAMDSMGRVECSACGNTRKPTRWDAAYL
ncbi:GNAT family acetyltransferase [Salinarchaeum sp. Harcht-Bsk1]|uniref:GNAT family N-acetyltransferase n=1 Tax=Salinarchaeum sp. Harcht-Bsk1 TaxID=1333523 RepID=UPI0003422D15|nr:GNAT family N-acetyltransferase [Salinarchaeum sp. Harcht-Bsk1]AGN01999.1 GNAT family acetyltransferase [Salinarchaeum sp. Harcht-Bsk1]